MGKELRIRLEQNTPAERLPRAHDYKVFDAETGEELTNVMRIEFAADAAERIPTVTLTLFGAAELDGVEVMADVEEESAGVGSVFKGLTG